MDMGGQEKYRKIYINNLIYFTETDFLYYLIDIQDELQFEENMQYLLELLKIYRDIGYSNEIIVFFNKGDPKFKANGQFVDRIEMIKNLILTQNKDKKFKIFNTSYYDISSLSKALSYSLNKLMKFERIYFLLKNLVEEMGCYHGIIHTNEGFIISDYNNETMIMTDFDQIISNKINEDLEFFKRLDDEKVNIDERLTFTRESSEYVKRVKLISEDGKIIVYLGISAPPKKINELKGRVLSFQEELLSF